MISTGIFIFADQTKHQNQNCRLVTTCNRVKLSYFFYSSLYNQRKAKQKW